MVASLIPVLLAMANHHLPLSMVRVLQINHHTVRHTLQQLLLMSKEVVMVNLLKRLNMVALTDHLPMAVSNMVKFPHLV
jgi:hypothetical protein